MPKKTTFKIYLCCAIVSEQFVVFTIDTPAIPKFIKALCVASQETNECLTFFTLPHTVHTRIQGVRGGGGFGSTVKVNVLYEL